MNVLSIFPVVESKTSCLFIGAGFVKAETTNTFKKITLMISKLAILILTLMYQIAYFSFFLVFSLRINSVVTK